jgi:hypothetical protein
LSTNANFCAKSAAYTTARLNGTWQVEFTKGTVTKDFSLPPVDVIPTTPVKFPQSVTISANSPSPSNPNGDPSINWTLLPGTNANGFRVNIYDKSVILANGQADIIEVTDILPTSTSFTPKVALKPGGNYAIGFQVIQTRDHMPLPSTGAQADILTRSNSFFDFSPPTSGSPPVIALPTITHTGVYDFNVGSVGPGTVTFIDPPIAIGYDYAIGANDPNFASVILPDVGGGHFKLSFLENGKTITDALNAGIQFFFLNGGVSAFEVTGINPSAKLDPGNAGAFVTGLTFESSGSFTGTMTPIVSSTPLPSTWVMLLGGLVGLGIFASRGAVKKNSAAFAGA